MEELLKALQIFAKYIPDEKWPTWCEHDTLHVNCDPDLVSDDEIILLDSYGFIPDEENEGFKSFKFGNC